MTTCICLSYTGPAPLGPTIQLTCNPSGTIINESTVNLTTNCPYCITVPSGTTTITAFDPITNCTEVIPVEPVINTPCSSGMDVVFCVDYTGSMGGVLNTIKSKISILSETIELLSQNNYRLGLVIFDEYATVPTQSYSYLNSFTYLNLPSAQKYANSNITVSRYQFITAMELLTQNNINTFQQNLKKLNCGYSYYLHKLNPDGSESADIDTEFTNTSINCLKIFNDNLFYGGNFTSTNLLGVNIPTPRIGKLTSNTNIDTSFITSGGFNNYVKSIDVNNLGQIVVVGNFQTYQGINRNTIALLNSNGSNVNSFDPLAGFNNLPNVVKFDQNGKILVGGEFSQYNLNPYNKIIRLNIDGTIDPTFVIGTGFDSFIASVTDFEIQPIDGKIIVVGSFTSYNTNTRNRIVRLLPDGTIDPSFNIGTGFNGVVQTVKLQPNGQILVGGQFSSYNTTPCNKIIRLNPDGSPDLLFVTNIGIGFNFAPPVTTIGLQSTGHIVVGGGFASFNGNNRKCILRLNPDGTFDSTFGLCGVSPGFDFVNPDASLVIDSQDNIYIAKIGNYNNTCYPGMNLGDGVGGPEPSDMGIDRIVNYNIAGSFNPTNSKFIILITDNPPSGNDDVYNSTDTLFVQNTLIPSCQANNVKVILVKPNYFVTGLSILEQLATSTGGIVISTQFNNNFNINQIATVLSTLC